MQHLQRAVFSLFAVGGILLFSNTVWAQSEAEAASNDETTAPAEATAEVESPWNAACELGGSLVAGNARTGTLTSGCTAGWTQQRWTVSLIGSVNYGRARYGGIGTYESGQPITEGAFIETQKNADLEIREQYNIADDESAYAFSIQGIATDEFAGYRLRINIEGGAGYSYFSSETQNHAVEGAVQYQHEQGIFDDDNRVGPIIRLLGNAEVHDMALWDYKLTYLGSFESAEDYRVNARTSFAFDLTERLAFKTGLQVKFDNEPSLITPVGPFGNEVAGVRVPARKTDISWTNLIVLTII